MEPPEPLRVAMSDQGIHDLADSLKRLGQLHALLVVPLYQNSEGVFTRTPDTALGQAGLVVTRYEIVDGHRRWYAAGTIGLEELTVTIFEDVEEILHGIMLDANVCREDVTAYEEGVQFLELAEKHQWSMDDLRKRFGKSEDYINDRVDCVRKDAGVAHALREREINLGQAKEILKAKDAGFRLYLLEQAAVHGATISTLRVMRQNKAAEEQLAQGTFAAHTPEAWRVMPAEEPAVCLWCGAGHDPENLRPVKVHWYHEKELQAVLDQFAVRNLLKPQEQKT
jgi:ParB-like chromosome segregation protein Spo0J